MYSPKADFFLLAPLIFALVLQSTLAKSNSLFHFCPSPSNYTSTSIFSYNLDTVLQKLAKRTPIHGFSTTTAGKDADKIYGLALCRGDVVTDDCKTCMHNGVVEIRQLCPYQKQGILWYDNCMLRYSDVDLFASIDTQNKFYMWNTQNVSQPELFNYRLGKLMDKLSKEAAERPSSFATGDIQFGDVLKIYGLAQCTRDLSGKACKYCLDNAIADIPTCCDGKQGGRVLTGSCNISYSAFHVKPLYIVDRPITEPASIISWEWSSSSFCIIKIVVASLRLLLAFTIMAMLVNVSLCTNYTVGAPNGSWEISTSLQAWASSHTFNPGDVLIFQYTPIHDLVEVTEADYDSCQVTNPIGTHTNGNTAFTLNTIGKRYFLCGVPGHCSLGMKMEIETVAPGAQPHPFALPPADQVPELSPSGSPLATLFPRYPLINAGTYGSSSGTQLPPPTSSSSPTKFSMFVNWAAVLILLLLFWFGF